MIPPELRSYFSDNCDVKNAGDAKNALADEILNNKKLLRASEGDSSDGSESEPSEDNLPIEEVAKVVPIVEKAQIKKLEKAIRQREEKEQALKPKPVPPKKKFEEPPI